MSNRLCERVCRHRGRFRTRAGSSPCAFQASRRQSWAFVSSGGFWETVNSNRNGKFFRQECQVALAYLMFFHSGKLRSSARSEASSVFLTLFHGRLRLEKSVLSGKASGNKKKPSLSNQETEVVSASRSKFPVFLAFPWATTAGKIRFKRESLDKQKRSEFIKLGD